MSCYLYCSWNNINIFTNFIEKIKQKRCSMNSLNFREWRSNLIINLLYLNNTSSFLHSSYFWVIKRSMALCLKYPSWKQNLPYERRIIKRGGDVKRYHYFVKNDGNLHFIKNIEKPVWPPTPTPLVRNLCVYRVCTDYLCDANVRYANKVHFLRSMLPLSFFV